MREDSGWGGRRLQGKIIMGRWGLPSFFQDKNQEQQINSARLWVQDELKEVILYGIVVKVCISFVQHLQGVKTVQVWRTMTKFHGQWIHQKVLNAVHRFGLIKPHSADSVKNILGKHHWLLTPFLHSSDHITAVLFWREDTGLDVPLVCPRMAFLYYYPETGKKACCRSGMGGSCRRPLDVWWRWWSKGMVATNFSSITHLWLDRGEKDKQFSWAPS